MIRRFLADLIGAASLAAALVALLYIAHGLT